jgi:hypothetical protein
MIEPSFFVRDSPSHGVQFGHPGSGPDPPVQTLVQVIPVIGNLVHKNLAECKNKQPNNHSTKKTLFVAII